MLVVGSGNGVSAIQIQRITGCKLTAVDISKEMVEMARENMPEVEFMAGNAEKLEFQDNNLT